jgi:hypothetical protein
MTSSTGATVELDQAVTSRYQASIETATTFDEQGKLYEELLAYVLSCLPDPALEREITRRWFQGAEVGIAVGHSPHRPGGLHQLPRTFLVGCLDWTTALGSTTVGRFVSILSRAGTQLGIMVAANGVTVDENDLVEIVARGQAALRRQKITVLVVTIEEIYALQTVADLVELINSRCLRAGASRGIGMPTIPGVDLVALAEARSGLAAAPTLTWDRLSSQDFERLLYDIVAEADDYANAQLLMHTNAPDRGRDISAEQVAYNSLCGIRHRRTIFQAKHWQSRSVSLADLRHLLDQTELWEPPVVHDLVIATTGRFVTDAVDWVQRHNQAGKRPEIHLWSESHLETLLDWMPHLVAKYSLM